MTPKELEKAIEINLAVRKVEEAKAWSKPVNLEDFDKIFTE